MEEGSTPSIFPLLSLITFQGMNRIAASEVFEAEELLEEIRSWSEEEIEELPELYQRKAREYRRQMQDSQK